MSDTAAMHPIVLAVAEHPDATESSIDEVFGFMSRLATMSAQYLTDYVVMFSTCIQVAGSRSRAERLLDMAQFAGYGQLETDSESGRRLFRLIDDPEFFHLKTAEEVAWERERKNNNSNYAITVPVRHRDGDACRYCGKVVNWRDRKGGKGGTYDHRLPGHAGSWQTEVVACTSCNSIRGNASKGLKGEEAMRAADRVLPLLPPPARPYYSPRTREWLNEHAEILALYQMVPPELAPAGTKTLRAGTVVSRPPAQSSSVGASAGSHASACDPGAGASARPGSQPGSVPSSTPAGDPGSTDHAASAGIPESGPAPSGSVGASAGSHASACDPGAARPGRAAHPAMDTDEALPQEPDTPEAGISRSKQIPADPPGPESGYAGSGRDGTGRAESGPAGPGCAGPGRAGPGWAGDGTGREAHSVARSGSPPTAVSGSRIRKRGKGVRRR